MVAGSRSLTVVDDLMKKFLIMSCGIFYLFFIKNDSLQNGICHVNGLHDFFLRFLSIIFTIFVFYFYDFCLLFLSIFSFVFALVNEQTFSWAHVPIGSQRLGK